MPSEGTWNVVAAAIYDDLVVRPLYMCYIVRAGDSRQKKLYGVFKRDDAIEHYPVEGAGIARPVSPARRQTGYQISRQTSSTLLCRSPR